MISLVFMIVEFINQVYCIFYLIELDVCEALQLSYGRLFSSCRCTARLHSRHDRDIQQLFLHHIFTDGQMQFLVFEQSIRPAGRDVEPFGFRRVELALELEVRWQPEPLVRTCVATMRRVDDFRWMVMAEAKRRHFFTAKKRAFVADGAAYNWTMRAGQFPDFVPILDFLHLAGYLYAAAKAFDPATVAERYRGHVHQCRWTGERDHPQ